MDRREGEGGGIGDGSNFNLDTTRPVPTDLTTYPTCAVPEPIPPQTRIQPSRGGSCSCCGGSSKAKRKEEEIGDMGIEMTDIEANVWAGTRKWEYFPGKNHFYCDGRIMTAPSIKYFSLSFALILLTFGLFIAFDAPFLTQRLSIAIPIVSSILFVLVISNMLKTSCSDPGIIPRASAAEVEHMERSYGNTAGTYRPPPRTKDIIVNGQVIKSKYCFTCRMFRPPRASHCSVCDNCVERFDHHCPFLGNCVGRRNYRSFYFFVVSLSLLAIFILSFSTTHLVLLARETGDFLEALRDTPTSAVVILISFFGMWTVIGLAGFHTYLIAVEQTTNEDIKGLFGRPNSRNPYSRGSTCGNCCYILCGPLSASLLDPRGIATPEYIDSIQKPKTVQLGNPGLQTQQPARTPVPNLAASYGLTQYSYTQPTSNGVDVSHLTSRHELEQKQAVPSKKIIPATNPHLRSNGVLPHQQDQMKAGTFPEILTNVTNPGSDGVSRNRGNGNAERVKSSPNELTSVDTSMVHLQTRLKSTHRIKEDGVASTALRSSPSAASLERLTMINSPLHLDPVT